MTIAKRIILLNRYFYPDHAPTGELLSSLAFALTKRGFYVEVITSRLRYDDPQAALQPREVVQGVRIWRVWTSRWGRQNLVGRSLDYLSFYLSASWRLLWLTRSGDIVVAKTDPPLLAVIVTPIVRLKGAKLINWLQDIFPEVAEAVEVGGSVGAAVFRLVRPLRTGSLKAADVNVVVGNAMASRLVRQGIARNQVQVIENWADGELIVPVPPAQNDLRGSWGLNDQFVVGYAGNLGRAHEFKSIMEAMSLLQERANESGDALASGVRYVFIGGGAQLPVLEQEIARRGLGNAQIHPYQPKHRLAQTLGVADLHLVSLKPELEGFVVPSKFYGIAAAGRPMLYIGANNSEMGRIIQEAGCGFAVNAGDGATLMARILHLAGDPALCALMGRRAREAFDQRWHKDQAIAKWIDLLNDKNGSP